MVTNLLLINSIEISLEESDYLDTDHYIMGKEN